MTAEALLPVPGDVIGGKYRVDARYASGGMAAIFAGEHLVLGQRVAIKVMLAESATEAAVERFMREAQAAARVETEHVTRVMDAGLLDNGLPFLVMELLQGCDLGALLANRGRLPADEAVDLMLEALEGLAHVHAAGIVHRDLKPSNLFLAKRLDGSSVVKLLDFGVSKSLVEPADDRVKVLTGNVVIGSPVYMSPEQVRSARSVDARSDIWSLGVALYELVTGALPFDGDGVGEVLAHILDGQPKPMRAHRPEVPGGLDAVVAWCFSRDRAQRCGSVAELAAALAPYGRKDNTPRLRRIEDTLVNAPLMRAPTSLGSLQAVRATHVERISDVIVPAGERREGSGAFALSRTFVDTDASARQPPAPASHGAWIAWSVAALSVLIVAGSFTFLRSAPALARVPTVMAAAPAMVPPPPVAAPLTPAAPSASEAAPEGPATHERSTARPKTTTTRAPSKTERPAFLKSRK